MSWREVRVDVPVGADTTRRRVVDGVERLAALYRLQNGEAVSDARFANIADGGEVDWSGFPLIAALEAVTGEEVRKLRELVSARPAASGAPRTGGA